ncbi:MAG: response regulator [Chitinophagaceae bacterium]
MKTTVAPVKILIAEDHVLIAETWNTLLNQQEGYEVLGKYGKTQEVIDATASLQPDIVLLDIALADGSGLDIIARLKKAAPSAKHLVVSAYADFATVKKAFMAGANGYITKTSSLAEMMHAIEEVMAGKTYRCREIQEMISGIFLSDATEEVTTQSQVLTKKEKQVSYLICKGYSAKEIAGKLGVSSKTIDVHRYHIYQKLGINKSIQLIRYIQDNQHLFTEVVE